MSSEPRVVVLADMPDLVVTTDSVTIPRAADVDITAGDIIVSTMGEGFLRSVDRVEQSDGVIVLTTSDAGLDEAVPEAHVEGSFRAGKGDAYQLPYIAVAFADKQLVNNDKLTARLVNGSLSFMPEVDLDLKVENHRLEEMALVMRGRLEGALDLELDVHEVEVGPDITLWSSPPAIFYQQVGALPVVETVTTSVTLKLQAVARGAGHVRIDASALANLAGGIRYTSAAGWEPIADVNVDASSALADASATLKQLGIDAWLAVRADVRLYGVAGPFVAAGPHVEVVRDLATGDFHAGVGVEGRAGGALKLWHMTVPVTPQLQLFDEMRPIF